MDWGQQLLEAIIYGVIFIATGALMKWFPPKNINRFYGYRTRRSMSSPEAWEFANKTNATIFTYLGVLLLFFGLLVYMWLPEKANLITLFAMLLCGVGGIYYCERLLKRRFDKNGRPKN